MTDRTEPSSPANKYTLDTSWSYNRLQFMYLTLLNDHKKLIKMYDSTHSHSFSLEKENSNLKTDLNHALEGHRRCYEANRTINGKLVPLTFEELNQPPVIHTGTIVNDEVE